MKNIIKIENIEYIKLSKYKELEKKKIKVIKKEITKETSPENCIILDPANVGGIFPINKNREQDEDIKIKLGLFRRVFNPNIESKYNDNYEIDTINIEGSKYSKKYFDKFKRMAGEFYQDIPKIYMRFSIKENRFLRNNPIIFLYGNNMAFCLAPKIDDKDL